MQNNAPNEKKKLFEFLNEFDAERDNNAPPQHPIIRLAKGSARIVYRISDDMVMKQAYNHKGIEQNKQEWVTWERLKDTGLLAKIYRREKNYKWIQMELCNRIRKKDFLIFFGLPFEEFQACIRYLKQKVRPSKKFVEKPYIYDFVKDKSWFKVLIDMVMNYDFATGDLKRLSSWGQTSEGKIVIIDYGLTYEIYRKYYSKDKAKIASEVL